MTAPRELKPGVLVTFIENDGRTVEGTINGPPWVYFEDGAAHARVPVFTDDGRTLDVAGHNLVAVR